MQSYTDKGQVNGSKNIICQNEIDISFKSIYFFIKIVECGNLTSASKELFVSQPSLSKTLQNLEERLGYPLFVRKKNKLVLTLRGEEFYKAFLPVINMVQENITRIREIEMPKINIAVSYTIDFFKLREKGFINRDFPFTDYRIECLNPFAIIKKMNDGYVDTAILLKDHLEIVSGADYFEIGNIKRNIIVSEKHKFAKMSSVCIADLLDEEIVIYIESGCNMQTAYHMAEKYFNNSGINVSDITCVTNYQTALLNIKSNNKIVLGEEFLPSFPYSGLVSVPIKDSFATVIAVVSGHISEEKRNLINKFYNKKE